MSSAPAGTANEIHHADGRVELRDLARVEASPLYNHDLAPVPIARLRSSRREQRSSRP